MEHSMTSRLLLPILLFAAALAPAQTQWSLVASTLTYHVSHPMHIVEGVSTQSRGKGVCAEGKCDFLIAAPVKSFTSGDSNRDLHMIQTVRGAQFPIVADLEVEFAGQTVHYQRVPFSKTANGTDVRITGTVPATCSDFKIERPSFLAVAIKNEIPVTIDMTWRSQSALPGPPQQPVKR